MAVVIIAVAFRLVSSSFKAFRETPAYDYASESMLSQKYEYGNEDSVGLSTRNISTAPSAVPFSGNSGTTGDTAEEFEITRYSATIETRQLDKTCSLVAGLKAREDVIFESASEYSRGCGYIFKVKRDRAGEILAVIKELNPKELSESTYTIKKLVDDYTSETEILRKKLLSIDETLEKAVNAYDDITALAARVQDVESLAKIIDSKISIIERLTQERISINSQLERIERLKSEQLDRLEYTYFNVDVIESKFVDGKNLKDSWKTAIKEFMNDINQSAQDITVNLVAFLFRALQYAIYFAVLLVVVKYGWQFVKYFWKK